MRWLLTFVSTLANRASEEGLKKLQAMDEAFTKLKQVTGVKNVEEMHEKFSNQKSNKLQLELEVYKNQCNARCTEVVYFCVTTLQVKDAEHRLAAAKKAYAKQEQIYQELKSSGSGMTELNRESINKYVFYVCGVRAYGGLTSHALFDDLLQARRGICRCKKRSKIHTSRFGAHIYRAGKSTFVGWEKSCF